MTDTTIAQAEPVLVAIDIAKARHEVLISVPGKKRRRIRHLHATVLGFELVERPLAQTVFAAHIRSRHPCFLFFDHPDNLGFAKSALSHLFAPSKG